MILRLEPPYELIADALADGEVIPFLGSGASRAIGSTETWSPEHGDRFPTSEELAEFLAKKANYPREGEVAPRATVDRNAGQTPTDKAWVPELRKAAQYVTLRAPRTRLEKYLDEIFTADHKPGPLHHYLAGIETPASRPFIVITTNYDDLLEQAFDEAGKPYALIVHTTDHRLGEQLLLKLPDHEFETRKANRISRAPENAAVIYKMHGSVRRDGNQSGQYVITDDDYVDFLARMTRWSVIPALLNEPLKNRSFLFLGYGLEDWNLRVLLSQLADHQLQPREQDRDDDRGGEEEYAPRAERRNWAIQKRPTLFDETYWRQKNVEVFDVTIGHFMRQMMPPQDEVLE